MRQPLVVGNWKLNGNHQMVNQLILELRQELIGVDCNVAIAPPTVYLDQAADNLSGSCIALGAQDVDINKTGAFTGETSAHMLKDIGVKYIIIGHSERRTFHKESDSLIAEKFIAVKEAGLIPIMCIGETEAEKNAGDTQVVCKRQLDVVLKNVDVSCMLESAVIAYEPVWAIGTGTSATPNQAQFMHKFIREHIAQYSYEAANKVIIQYGGSVNSANATKLFAQPDIDGALVGGASLQAKNFAMIVKAASKNNMTSL
ncbi:triose-phosphate isomerase [Candidatus Profftia tarda]|nr:triose-phosphate isomerase [Candidatus Profftia tarda]